MTSLRITAFALALLGSSMVIGQASAAMPVNGLTPARTHIANNVQHARYVCGPRGCWWRPGWGRRYYGGPYCVTTGGPGAMALGLALLRLAPLLVVTAV